MKEAEVLRIIEERVLRRLAAQSEGARAVGTSVAIEIRGDGGGRWIVDCAVEPPTLTASKDAPAMASISMELEVFEGLVGGSLSPQSAFLSGKVRIDGDLGAAVRLGSLLI